MQVIPLSPRDQPSGKLTWPRLRRKREPRLKLTIDHNDKFCAEEPPWTQNMHGSVIGSPSGIPWSPESIRHWSCSASPLMTSPLPAFRAPCVQSSMPQTPASPFQHKSPSAIELPGSLLLASQGFAQLSHPPMTPPHDNFTRQTSFQSSVLSSTPALSADSSTSDLCFCPEACESPLPTDFSCKSSLSVGADFAFRPDSNFPTSTTSANLLPPFRCESGKNMEYLRTFSPQKPATTLSKRPSSSRSNSSSAVPRISKPFSSMTAEELIQCVPQLSPSIVQEMWLPAMEREHRKIKALLQEAAEVKVETNNDLTMFSKV